jgi:hypothetical protein
MNLISIPFTPSAVISSHQGELLLITPRARMDLATTPRSKHCGLASEGVSEGPASPGFDTKPANRGLVEAPARRVRLDSHLPGSCQEAFHASARESARARA